MLIYEQEILDGLKDVISNNLSVAFQCLLTKSKMPFDVNEDSIKKTIAGFIEDGRNFDLYNISSILASIKSNKNDDWFLPEEIWAARETPVYKQVNYGHNEKDIIGVITGTTVLDKEANKISDESQINNLMDIVSHAVIWSYWEDESLKGRFAQIVDDIENEKLFVSMESLFKNFDYMLVKNGVETIVKRDKDTSFLTKYLRIYNPEATGEYNGYRIYRLLRNFTFSGMALVENPANARSIINDNLRRDELDEIEDKIEAEKLFSKSLAENIMDPNEIAINALKAELAQAKAELETFKHAEAQKTSAEIAELKAVNESLQKQVAELTSLAQAAKEDMKKAESEKDEEMKMMKDECEVKVAEANTKLAELISEKATATRLNKLTSVNVEASKAQDILKAWASVSDEHFDKIVELYATNPSKVKSETVVEDGLEAAKASTQIVNPNGDSDLQKAVAQEKALAEKIAAQFNFSKKNKKGSK